MGGSQFGWATPKDADELQEYLNRFADGSEWEPETSDGYGPLVESSNLREKLGYLKVQDTHVREATWITEQHLFMGFEEVFKPKHDDYGRGSTVVEDFGGTNIRRLIIY